ncbi:Pyrimidine 5-nucleotidase domain-containing protein [Paramicrosporidium saccamoebae]|uniref:Pyrimidine 5-nucleotidase domain-containing protein n=1 Tax=Paramicrosporidium saccamoebae TaxID=1246581 RepID=A0A2H9TJ37_9FUNG|nr:Pyrimidine 5-nucleotidase domain-containing protein [Paramicrosporidium saccamoebae]
MLLRLAFLISTAAAATFVHHFQRLELTSRPKLVIDLDNTCYSHSCGLNASLISAIDAYAQTKLGYDFESAKTESTRLYRQYGMTSKGLARDHNINLKDYEDFIDQNVDYTTIGHDDRLLELLKKVEADVIVFTNSGIKHTTRTLEILGVLPYVHMVIYAECMDPEFTVKPFQEAYGRVETLLQSDPSNLYFLDDNETNVRVAQERGWNVAHVFEFQEDAVVPSKNAIQVIKYIYDTPSVFSDLFAN